ncbi:unnamed protein product, partial [Symbiodinium microadriaticum]
MTIATCRILFAEHFNVQNAYSLVADAVRQGLDSRLEITFLSSDSTLEHYFNNMVGQCLGDIALMGRTKFIALRPGQRLRDALRGHADGCDSSYFDYVEYFNGLSFSPTYEQDLNDLREVIGVHGIIGVSMYMKNIYQQQIQTIVKNMNRSAHIPLSTEPRRAVKAFLEDHQLKSYAEDTYLVDGLSLPSLRAFSKGEVVAAVGDADMKILSWLPSAIMDPYEKISHQSVQR